MTIYLDCAATTPIDPRVQDLVMRYLGEDFGNAGSRTHDFGRSARQAVEKARSQLAAAAFVRRGEVVFTSGATEANNLAILGLAEEGIRSGRRHVISTAMEHHAVLEPLLELEQRGFEVERLTPGPSGRIEAGELAAHLREDTLLVSVMQVNNETGIRQPIAEIASILQEHTAFYHVDAAQGFGRENEPLRDPRVDLISLSGHKIHAPKGVGALLTRKRNGEPLPLKARSFGGGQEWGLRPGTLPVALIAGLGLAAELATDEAESRAQSCGEFETQLLNGLAPLKPHLHGAPEHRVAHLVNLSFPGLDSDQVIEAWQDLVAISDGAACTSQSYTCSHVLTAMGIERDRVDGAVRLSWCHTTPPLDLDAMLRAAEVARTDARREAR